jgi:HTH-type transcriptional regulator/antitoxin HigA
MAALAINPAAIAPAWRAFQRALPIKIGAIHNEAEYDSVVSFMNSLLDVVGDNEEHEFADLLDLVAQLVEDYEGTRHTPPDATPHEALRILMDQRSVKQADLAAEIGGRQSVVSDILNGKREINARQAKALAARFGVSAGVFL